MAERWRFAGTLESAPDTYISYQFAFSDGPDLSEEARIPADATFVTLQSNLTGASEDIQVGSV